MPLVLPGGDYEAALRMAGASNFMEALESGVDRNIRRQGARQQMRQSRDLYERQSSLERAKLQAEMEEAGGFGGAAGAARGKGGAGGGLPSVSMQDALSQVVADYEEGVALQGLAQQRIAEEEAARAAIAATPADPGYTSKQIWYPHGDLLPDPTMEIESGGGPSYEEIVGRADAFEAAGDMENAAALREVAGVLAPISVVGDPWRPASRQRARGPAQKPVVRGEDTRGERFYSEGMRLWSAGSQDEAIRSFEAARASGYKLPPAVEGLLSFSVMDVSGEMTTGRDPFRGPPTSELRPAVGRGLAPSTSSREARKERERAGREREAEEFGRFREGSLATVPARGEPTPLPGDEERLAAINERERENIVTPMDLIDRQAILQRQFGLPEGRELIEPEAAFSADRETAEQYQADYEADRMADLEAKSAAGTASGDELRLLADLRARALSRQLDSPSRRRADPAPGLDRALGIEPATPPVSLPEEEAIDLITPSPVASVGALGPSLLGGAISQMIDEGRIPAERVSPPPDERLGLKAAAQVPDDQLSSAIASLSGGDTAGLSDLTGIQDAGERGRQIDEALVELQRRQEAASLADAPTPDSAEAVKLGDYTVKKGDYISKLAKGSGTTTKAIVAANRDVLFPDDKARQYKKGGKTLLSGQDLIFPGDVLRIPTGEGAETGGPAGDVDPRKDAPKGTLAELLEKQGEKAKTIEGLRSALEELQSTQPDKLVNPFQKFGRDIAYLPSLRAVAFAVNRAEQGDFSMINQMAGRIVKNYELEGLFADYSGFVSGTKRKANEIYRSEALAQQTAKQEKRLAAINATQMMAYSQFVEAGYKEDEAKIFSGFYSNLYEENPEQARAWSRSLDAMGKDRRTALAKRLKYGSGTGTGRGTGKFSDKDIKRQVDIVDKFADNERQALEAVRVASVDYSGAPLSEEDLRTNLNYIEAVTLYDEAQGRVRVAQDKLNLMQRGGEAPPGDERSWLARTETVEFQQLVSEAASSGDWDGLEAELKKSNLYGPHANEIRRYYEVVGPTPAEGAGEEATPKAKPPPPPPEFDPTPATEESFARVETAARRTGAKERGEKMQKARLRETRIAKSRARAMPDWAKKGAKYIRYLSWVKDDGRALVPTEGKNSGGYYRLPTAQDWSIFEQWLRDR